MPHSIRKSQNQVFDSSEISLAGTLFKGTVEIGEVTLPIKTNQSVGSCRIHGPPPDIFFNYIEIWTEADKHLTSVFWCACQTAASGDRVQSTDFISEHVKSKSR